MTYDANRDSYLDIGMLLLVVIGCTLGVEAAGYLYPVGCEKVGDVVRGAVCHHEGGYRGLWFGVAACVALLVGLVVWRNKGSTVNAP